MWCNLSVPTSSFENLVPLENNILDRDCQYHCFNETITYSLRVMMNY